MIEICYKLSNSKKYSLHDCIDIPMDKRAYGNKENKIICFVYKDYSEFCVGLKVGYQKDTKMGIFKILSENIKLKGENKDKLELILRDDEIVKIEDNLLPQVKLIIENLTDYVAICEYMNKINVLYRGQSDEYWGLTPSIFRNKMDIAKEKQVYKDLLQWNDKQFSSDDYIVNACNMQHYGIPTRLLDWTSNSLQALYFACTGSSGQGVDGQVIMLNVKEIFDIDSDEYKYINRFIENRYKSKHKAEDIKETLSKLLFNGREHLFFRTLYSNNRVKTQQGYFSVYIDLTYDEAQIIRKFEMKNIWEDVFKEIQRETKYRDDGKYNIIKANIVDNISTSQKLDEVIDKSVEIINARMGIREGNKKVDIKKVIKEGFKKSGYDKIIKRNDNMGVILEKENHIKIVIRDHIKCDILESINAYGINSRSIYPDIEGLSKYMRERYQ